MRELIKQAWQAGWWDRLLLIIIVLVIILAGLGAWAIINNRMNRIDTGTVVSKHYQEAFTSYVTSGKTTLPVLNPETFTVIITNGDKTYRSAVPESIWESVREGDTLNLKTMEVQHGQN